MASRVHASAVVDAKAELGDGVVVGPLCYVGPDVCVGDDTELVAHVTLLGPCRLGRRNRVHPFAVLGSPPQDRSYEGEPTELTLGDDNELREHVTVHRGTRRGGGATRVGSSCLLMVGSHVAHDCVVGDRVTLTNGTSLGGHVRVDDGAVCAGHAAVAQFVRLGRLCFVAGGAMVERDVPPFVIAAGDRARVRALNRVGLERAGVPPESRRALRRAFRMIFRSGDARAKSLAAARSELGGDPFVRELVDFLFESSLH